MVFVGGGADLQLYIVACSRIESGSDDPHYLGNFLNLNYLDVTRIFNRSHLL